MITLQLRQRASFLLEQWRPWLPVPQGLDQLNPLTLDYLQVADKDFQFIHCDSESLSEWRPLSEPNNIPELRSMLPKQASYCATLLLRSRPWRAFCQHGQVLRISRRIVHDPSTNWDSIYGRSWPLSPALPRRGLILNLTNHGTPNLYHWLFNPTLQLLRQLESGAFDASKASAIYLGPAWPDVWPTYVEKTLMHLGLAQLPRIRRAVWPQQLLMSVFASTTVAPSPTQFQWLRRHLSPPRLRGGLRLYLGRALAGRRRVLNERPLMAALESLGFTCIPDPSNLDFEHQCRLLSEADVVVAPHGAVLSLLFCCAPGTKILEVHCPGYLSPLYAWMAAFGGLRYRSLMGCARANPAEPQMDDLWVDISLVLHHLADWGIE
mgnify:CR=1 FL=1